MSAIMDMYFNNSESMSLQEMLDIDIKSEIDTLIGGHNDLSGLNFSDLPPLELDDVHDIRWFSHNSNSSFTLDFNDESKMVNPNVVMPVITLAQNIRSPSPTLKESHLAFSPSAIKISGSKPEPVTVKKDLLKKLDGGQIVIEKPTMEKKTTSTMTPTTPIIKTINKVTPILSKTIVKAVTGKAPTLLTFRNTVGSRQMNSPVTVAHLTNLGTVRTIAANHHGRKQQFGNHNNNNHHHNSRVYEDDAKSFPKPAYSYSCLIAMALKNSRSGSLPVSEIYNFMCKHFPYFKTAPNGWKNSVRHNLSLNKCFEKIEKPALNGAQRKGCLWAMNPAKISKMDEEVQKWSRKDPTAIRKAMVNPEHLESLERGELKFSCSYDEDTFGDSCGSADSEGSDSEPDVTVPQNDYIDVRGMKMTTQVATVQQNEDDEDDEEDEEEGEEYDVEVADSSMYDDDDMEIENDHQILRMEMALAQKELLEYGRNQVNSTKRKKPTTTTTYYIQN
ncbi:PREDICTED: meiosis-specific transcription factor mei4 [Nicrophorus vespilloides]|uniref:Meiosis-specific transcription factor mei4 n=1 Tax=Nicrophorus vespilloides TaxID=110193 RepID=A0ABM1MV67_NICVS|nr:PREDICTED: meiosis-specific transcription factor mei4 [Nicrophorus vespilloides]XP_017778467.1 PREDICTED: meiosis-specific transcription factor mei4 [Nicrophorus vespilloides]